MKVSLKKSVLLLACAACVPAFAPGAVVETASPEAAAAPEITVLLPGKAHGGGQALARLCHGGAGEDDGDFRCI